jgi:putative transposase
LRKPRFLKNGATYHVIARINRMEFILEDNEIRDLFLNVLKESKKKYKFQIINFCVMYNHIHLIIKPAEEMNLSKIMQWVLSVFAIRFNKIFKYLGHVWMDRFKSKIINDIRQLFDTFRYIANNPVKANLVKKAEDYKHNGVRFIKMKNFDIIEPPSPFLNLFYKLFQ